MGVHAQPLENCILLRCGATFQNYGDPWTFSVIVEIGDGFTAFLAGGCGKSYAGMRKEIKDKLKEMGFQRVEWERRSGDKIKKVEDTLCQ